VNVWTLTVEHIPAVRR